ncbi:MAG: ATP-binding protein [Desulfurococcales archaeon]|nr:ATP-binding protein [Desulfurococcales archaeon]
MLFDPRPKKSRKELFNRAKELRLLDESAVAGDPLVVVTGIRRIGKTSLLLSFLEKWNGIYVDLRGVAMTRDLYDRISEGLTSRVQRLRRLLKNIHGVKVMGIGVEVKWRGRDSVSLIGLLEQIDRTGERFLLVLDEAQATKPPVSAELKRTIAYAYDNLDNITVVISGSEIGVLHKFIGTDDPESMLYGRYIKEVEVERFTREQSLQFLKAGFSEQGFKPNLDTLREAVSIFDGIVGWLVFFGKSYVEGKRNTRDIVEMAVRTARKELGRLGKRERLVLKAITRGAKSWGRVKKYMEEREGVTIPKSSLSRTISKLEKLSIIKQYKFLDPIYEIAARELHT